MDDEPALLAAIEARPDDDTPRLAYADWLDERGTATDRALAAFIRLQCDLARTNTGAGPGELSQKENELLAAAGGPTGIIGMQLMSYRFAGGLWTRSTSVRPQCSWSMPHGWRLSRHSIG